MLMFYYSLRMDIQIGHYPERKGEPLTQVGPWHWIEFPISPHPIPNPNTRSGMPICTGHVYVIVTKSLYHFTAVSGLCEMAWKQSILGESCLQCYHHPAFLAAKKKDSNPIPAQTRSSAANHHSMVFFLWHIVIARSWGQNLGSCAWSGTEAKG